MCVFGKKLAKNISKKIKAKTDSTTGSPNDTSDSTDLNNDEVMPPPINNNIAVAENSSEIEEACPWCPSSCYSSILCSWLIHCCFFCTFSVVVAAASDAVSAAVAAMKKVGKAMKQGVLTLSCQASFNQ